jgi:hypothetical protein
MGDRRTHIAKEVLSTERTFVKSLKTIVDVRWNWNYSATHRFINFQVYLIPMRVALEDGRPIIKQRHIERITVPCVEMR